MSQRIPSLLALFFGLILSLSAQAGREGNGADIVACSPLHLRDSSSVRGDNYHIPIFMSSWNTQVSLLDFYEAKKLDANFKIDLGSEDLSEEEKATLVLERLGQLRPDEYEALMEKFELQEVSFDLLEKNVERFFKRKSSNKFIDDILDEGVLPPLDNLCKIYQLIKVSIIGPQSLALFYYQPFWWKLLDANNRAAVAIHEAIYIVYRHQGFPGGTRHENPKWSKHKTSEQIRAFTAFVCSQKFSQWLERRR